MITERGRNTFLRDLSDEGFGFAESMAFGVGTTAPTDQDQWLEFEVHRSEVEIIDIDPDELELLVRATIADFMYFDVNEVALITQEIRLDDELQSRVIFTFSSDTEEEWEGFTAVDTTNPSRIGPDSLRVDVDAGGSIIVNSVNSFGVFDEMPGASEFVFAVNALVGVTNVSVRFHVDNNNYREHSFTPASGFGVYRWTKNSMALTGTAGWDDFEYMEIQVDGADGDSLLLEGLRVDIPAEDGEILVARTVLAETIEKRGVAEVEVQYRLGLSFA